MQIGMSDDGSGKHSRYYISEETTMDGDLAFWIEWAEERVAKGKGRREGAGGEWKEVAQVAKAKCPVKKGEWSGVEWPPWPYSRIADLVHKGRDGSRGDENAWQDWPLCWSFSGRQRVTIRAIYLLEN